MFARSILPCVVVILMAAATPAQDAKKELDKLQGEWTMASLETRGKKAQDEAVKGFKLTIKGNEWNVQRANGKGNMATFKIDPSKNPKTLDLIFKLGEKEMVSRGIYKLEVDTLTLCRVTEKDTARPKDFKTTAEEGILVTWQRTKK